MSEDGVTFASVSSVNMKHILMASTRGLEWRREEMRGGSGTGAGIQRGHAERCGVRKGVWRATTLVRAYAASQTNHRKCRDAVLAVEVPAAAE